jgi:hypothetical protein
MDAPHRLPARLLLAALALGEVGVANGAVAGEPGVGPAVSPATVTATLPSEAWWTGSLLSASADTMPVGHWLIEPYGVDSHVDAVFDADGHRHAVASSVRDSAAAYVMYGLADGVSVGLQPRVLLRSRAADGSTAGAVVGDLTLMLQVRLLQPTAGRWQPTTSLVLSQTLPTGRYDHLAPGASGASGAGVYRTDLGFYAQSLDEVLPGHLLRSRLNATVGWSDRAGVAGRSVYGTPDGFEGSASPGLSASVDVAFELSLSRHWVLALDLAYQGQARSIVEGRVEGASDIVRTIEGASRAWAVAPALEYNFNARVGLIAGLKVTVAGRNVPADRVGAIALNMFF